MDVELAKKENALAHGNYLYPIFFGKYEDTLLAYFQENDICLKTQEKDLEIISAPLDFFGLNCYNRRVVSAKEVDVQKELQQNGGNFLQNGNEYYPNAIYDTVKIIRKEYKINLPIYITENGVGFENEEMVGGIVNDRDRHEALEKEIRAIYDCGIKMFCVESRPHPEFCKEQWWEDFAFILQTAKSLGMQVWLLDDKHYPTGYANGALENRLELKQRFIRSFVVDFYGDGETFHFVTNYNENDRFLTAFVYERTDNADGINVESGAEITDFKDNVLTVQSGFTGYCRLVIFSITTNYSLRENYIDMLNSASCQMMIDAIYEPHYAHFSQYFGETFVGFFSDEPRFMNGAAEQSFPRGFYETSVGQYGVVYPWCEELFSLLGCEKKEIVALWLNTGEKYCADFRIAYMDTITRLYQENFSEMLGKWCEEHGVLYTGHIIEDAGNHCRLGTGAGHYFRSMIGQHMSGIDVVLHQIETDSGDRNRFYCGPTILDDHDFFHYTLAKLGVSAAHLEEKKENRAMCEIFGAYGWGEAINQMKWLVDFMLVRGINYFVPHRGN